MKRCGHEVVLRAARVEFAPGVQRTNGSNCRNPLVDAKRCLSCGAWLPLGPAADDEPNVQIELRAAELAHHIVDILPLRMQGWNLDEEHGWRDHGGSDMEPMGGPCPCSESQTHAVGRNWHAGYLARCIATHDDATANLRTSGE